MRSLLVLLGFIATAVRAVPSGNSNNVQAPSTYWYERVKHNGISPTIANGTSWTVYRNVKDFGAKGDGSTDDTSAIQRAISMGDSTGSRLEFKFGSTGQPAVVYFPPGTYMVNRTIQNAIGTVLMGDPNSRPSIKATPGFNGTYLLFGRDLSMRASGLVGFYHEIKNLILDTTAMPKNSSISLLEWGISQGCQLSNVLFNMPIGANHTGIIAETIGSPLLLNDLQFVGGAIGYRVACTQYHFKNLHFKNIGIGLKIDSLVQATGQGLRFEGCKVGIDTSSGGSGFFALIDSWASNTSVVVNAAPLEVVQGSLALQNVVVDSSVPATVKINSTTALTGSVEAGKTWIRGNVYNTNSTSPNRMTGSLISTPRPAALVDGNGSYHTVVPPTYAEFDVSQVVNVKDVPGFPVAGDAVTDDRANLQAILNNSTGKLVYFPHGIYLLSDTLVIPPGSRLVGESWSEFSATGNNFKDAKKPRPMIKLGNAGDEGIGQLTDFLFTVADILPGAVMLEVNMAGPKPGDVAFFNCHFRIAGGRGSKVQQNCADPKTCVAARIAGHFTESSSVYMENSWIWNADHDLDDDYPAAPSTAGGFLIEARKGTWMLGIGSEHASLYQMNINRASNVFIGIQQGESAYWQGKGTSLMTPAPWTDSLLPSDPDWTWCQPNDAQCRMGLYQRVSNSTNLSLFSGGFWNFVAGPNRTFCATACQDNAVHYESNTKMQVFGISVINIANLVLESGVNGDKYAVAAPHGANSGTAHDGFDTAVMAAYLRQSG